MTVPPTRALVAALAVALTLVLGSCTSTSGSSVDCAGELRLDGASYRGFGELEREPPTTGRRATAVAPACGDSGPAERVTVSELDGIAPTDAVLAQDGLWIRDGLDVPAAARPWFVAPTCTTDGVVDLTADWWGVTGPNQPRSDGDLRPPYVLDVHVTDGPPEYLGTTIEVRADETTAPGLGPGDVRSSLWEGGQVAARVTCDGDRFLALSLRVP